eukprot:Plantae.Rhodophyta-Hildenbrandia_rubra.ctg9723.p1 GENE.Plantae.Rhodophyta-Hildenbrandia_rubra.ctg9723~~Plantae.Rhodophyta-Hildenbrandia_rubra.ctg9723.p1  ORF type:complete len:306 (+),score=28.12 Plantae.Rhodophyta-Hildenbrandia_rubra.ctg9723:286-1203(+)
MARALRHAGRLASAEDRKLLEKTVDQCHQCIRSSSLPRRPAVGYPHPTTFNNRVAMDIFTVNGAKFLHVICLGAHLSRIVPLSIFKSTAEESSTNVFEIFCSFWINYLGVCDALVVDQGKNFVSQEFHYSCEAYGINLKPASTNAPWANGVVEVFHKPASKIIAALQMEAPGLHSLIYSFTAERAMNDVVNAYGLSPYILVYGVSRRLPIGPSGSTLHNYSLRMKLQTMAQLIQTRIQSDLRLRKASSTTLRHVADLSIGEIMAIAYASHLFIELARLRLRYRAFILLGIIMELIHHLHLPKHLL